MSAKTPRTLWAKRPLNIASGRIIGVRQTSPATVLVAYVRNGSDKFVWTDPLRVISERQADAWIQSTTFSPS